MRRPQGWGEQSVSEIALPVAKLDVEILVVLESANGCLKHFEALRLFQDLYRSLVHNFCEEAKKSLLKLRRHFDSGFVGVRQRIAVKEALPEGLVTPTSSKSSKKIRERMPCGTRLFS